MLSCFLLLINVVQVTVYWYQSCPVTRSSATDCWAALVSGVYIYIYRYWIPIGAIEQTSLDNSTVGSFSWLELFIICVLLAKHPPVYSHVPSRAKVDDETFIAHFNARVSIYTLPTDDQRVRKRNSEGTSSKIIHLVII